MSNKKLWGLHEARDRLHLFFQKKQVPHALLLYGQPSIGKHFLARSYARLLNCVNPVEGQEPCGECLSCCRAVKNLHPDIHEIFPSGQTISIDSIRQVIELSNNHPQMKKYNIFIIDGFEMMLPAAANAFLKVLEEPATAVQFLLISHQKSRIIDTLLSRVTEVYCASPSKNELEQFYDVSGLPVEVRALLPCLFDTRVGQMITFLKREDNHQVNTSFGFMEALAGYEESFSLFSDKLEEELNKYPHFPAPCDVRDLLDRLQITLFTLPRFRLLNGLFLMKEKPKRSTLHFVVTSIEKLLGEKKQTQDRVKSFLEKRAREFHEKEGVEELARVSGQLVQRFFLDESLLIFQQILRICHFALQGRVQSSQKERIYQFASPGFSESDLLSIYHETEKTIVDIKKNGYLSLQISALFLKIQR